MVYARNFVLVEVDIWLELSVNAEASRDIDPQNWSVGRFTLWRTKTLHVVFTGHSHLDTRLKGSSAPISKRTFKLYNFIFTLFYVLQYLFSYAINRDTLFISIFG